MKKQKQIEEMANYYREYRKNQTGEKFYEFIDDKVPDNVVVLTGRVAGRTGDIWRQAQEKTRKETAKEILQELYDHCFELVDPFGDDCEECYGSCDKYYILAIAKQYGVEVEE